MESQTEARPVYELMVMGATEDFSTIKERIKRFGGVVRSEKPAQKLRLAYPIKKQQYCFSATMEIELPPLAVKDLTNELKLDESVLRSAIYIAPEKIEEQSEKRAPRRPVRTVRKTAETALTNEALEKKIEEILQ